MSERLTVSTADGDFAAYVAVPEGPGPFPAIVVLQEIFGVNPFVRNVADRLAAQGYLAVAPDLFWRIDPGVDITDQSEAEWKKAFELMNAFDLDQGVKDIAATIALVRADPRCDGKVGAVGYCLGGRLAFMTAARTDVNASVGYYGVGIDGLLAEKHAIAHPVLLHVPEEDHFVDKAAQQRMHEGLDDHPKVTIFDYPGEDHGFATEFGLRRSDASAKLADERTATFFAENLG